MPRIGWCVVKLAIADPPYPPHRAERRDVPGGPVRVLTRSRSRRWYGDGTRPRDETPADFHPEAAEWDDPARHRALIEQLMDEYDGWALATSPDGIEAYRPLPLPARVMVWVKPNAIPGGNRLRSMWEPVITYVPESRRNRRGGQVPDVLSARAPRIGFPGAKPPEWTRWVLEALGHDKEVDTVDDLFPGSGAVTAVLNNLRPGTAEPAAAQRGLTTH